MHNRSTLIQASPVRHKRVLCQLNLNLKTRPHHWQRTLHRNRRKLLKAQINNVNCSSDECDNTIIEHGTMATSLAQKETRQIEARTITRNRSVKWQASNGYDNRWHRSTPQHTSAKIWQRHHSWQRRDLRPRWRIHSPNNEAYTGSNTRWNDKADVRLWHDSGYYTADSWKSAKRRFQHTYKAMEDTVQNARLWRKQ